MLEFATLFLGLIWGVQPIELVVGNPEVAKVQVRLDGHLIGAIKGPPWKGDIDFGVLAPHRLQIAAFDAQGKELASAEQWVNMPKPPAEARLVLEQDEQGRPKKALLNWESVDGSEPKMMVRFDGQDLPVTSPQFDVPVADADELHFLTAELIFDDGSTAHAEASFGGQFGDQVETELTAFPVRQLKAGAPLKPLYDCILGKDGEPLKVALVERGAAEVLIVRDEDAEVILRRLRSSIGRMALPSLRGTNNGRSKFSMEYMRYDLALEDADRVRFVWPNVVSTDHPHFKNAGFFESSPFVTGKDGGLYFFLTNMYPEKKEGPQHLADALALAGLRAAAEGRRRAVILVLGDRPHDGSAQTPASTRGFLEALQVPLHVWAGASPEKAAQGWPAPRGIATHELLRQAARELQKDLDSQRVVWIAGRYLPSEIHLVREGCPDFAPLSAPPPAKN